MYKSGFIGAGNMGSALIIAASKQIGGEQILIADHNQHKLDALAELTGCRCTDSILNIAAECEYIFLAVKPYAIRDVVKTIAPVLKKNAGDGVKQILVTIAAGIDIETISTIAEGVCPVLRLMPNTPAAVGKGTTLITYNADMDMAIVDEFKDMMSKSGSFEYIPEAKFDTTSSISGCTPAFAYMFIESLADGAVQVGVPRETAIRLAAQTVLGAAAMILETGKHPDKLKDEVCSPGGSTIVGVSALEANNFRYAAAQAIVQSTEKNHKLGK